MVHTLFATRPRPTPQPARDAAIMYRIDGMIGGDSLAVTTRDDPVALIAEIEQRHPGVFSFRDLRTEPGCWHFVVRRCSPPGSRARQEAAHPLAETIARATVAPRNHPVRTPEGHAR